MNEVARIYDRKRGVMIMRFGSEVEEFPLTLTPAELDAAAAAFGAAPGRERPVPETVDWGALLMALLDRNVLTQAQVLAAARTGAVPASFSTILDGLTARQQFEMNVRWAAGDAARRSSPFWTRVVNVGLATSQQIDNCFRDAGAS